MPDDIYDESDVTTVDPAHVTADQEQTGSQDEEVAYDADTE